MFGFELYYLVMDSECVILVRNVKHVLCSHFFIFRSSSRFASASGGPVIREVTDDDEDGGNNHKRRKGFFGRLFKESDE